MLANERRVAHVHSQPGAERIVASAEFDADRRRRDLGVGTDEHGNIVKPKPDLRA